MKKDTHPKYYAKATFTCACGNVVTAGSTIESQSTDICSKCHPFYTGKHKLVDTAGRVDKFRDRQKKAQAMQEDSNKDPKKASKDDKADERYLTVEDMKSLKETGKKAAPKKAAKKEEVKEEEVKEEAADEEEKAA